MAENGITQLILNDRIDDGYENDGFHPSDKPKKGMTTTTLLNGDQEEPNIRASENGHIPVTSTTSSSATNNGTVFLNGHDVANDTTVIVNGHFTDENVNLNCNSTDKELSKCSLDNKLRHYVPVESDGKKLNSDETRIAIPDDAVINFNTGRIRLSKNAANSPNFSELSDENDCEKEKIPLQDFSTPVKEDNPKAIEASQDLHQNGHGPDDHQYSGGSDVVLTTDSLSNEKLQQSNGTGKFEEYFIPVNTHKKYLRGEKLYLTKDNPKLCENWRRCIICGLIAIVIAVAILVGVLAATGILLAESDSKSATAAISVAGRHSRPPSSNVPQNPLTLTTVDVPASTTTTTNQPVVSEATSQATLKVSPIVPVLRNASQSRTIVPNALVGEFIILNSVFTDDLNDNTSAAYLTLATHIETEFSTMFKRYGGQFETLKVLKFSPGSIAVRFVTVWKNPRHVIMAKDAYEIIRAYIENHNNLFLNYEIDSNRLNFIDVVNECSIQNGECSHDCHWSYLTLKKVCLCEDGMELDADGKTCVAKPPQTISTFSTFTRLVMTTKDLSTESTISEVSTSESITTTNSPPPSSISESLTTVGSTDADFSITTTESNFAGHSFSTSESSKSTSTDERNENTSLRTTSIPHIINETATHNHDHESHHTTQMVLTTFVPLNESTTSSILSVDTTTDINNRHTGESIGSTYGNEDTTVHTTTSFEEIQVGTDSTGIVDDHAEVTTNNDMLSSTISTLAYTELSSNASQEKVSSTTSSQIPKNTTIVHSSDDTDSTTVHFTSSTNIPTSMDTGSIEEVTILDGDQSKNISENTTSYATTTVAAGQKTNANDYNLTSTHFAVTDSPSELEIGNVSDATTSAASQGGEISDIVTSGAPSITTIIPVSNINTTVTDLNPTSTPSSTSSLPVSETENIQLVTLVSNSSFSSVGDNSDHMLMTQETQTDLPLITTELNTEPTVVIHNTSAVLPMTTPEIKTESVLTSDVVTETSPLFSETATEPPLIENTTETIVASMQTTYSTVTDITIEKNVTDDNTLVTIVEANNDPFTSSMGENEQNLTAVTVINGEGKTSVSTETPTISGLTITEKSENVNSSIFSEVLTETTSFSNTTTFTATNVPSIFTPVFENVSHGVVLVTEPILPMNNITVENTENITDSGDTTLMTSPFPDTMTSIEEVISEDIPISITTTTPSTTEASFHPLTESPIGNTTDLEANAEVTTILPPILTTSDFSMVTDAQNMTMLVEIPSTENYDTVSNVTSDNSLIIPDDNATMFTLTTAAATTESSLITESKNETDNDTIVSDLSINGTTDDILMNETLQNTTFGEAYENSTVASTDMTTSFEMDSENATVSSNETGLTTSENDNVDILSTDVELGAVENTTADILSTETNLTTSENDTINVLSTEMELTTSDIENFNVSTSSSLIIEFGSSSTLEDYDSYNSTLNTTILNATDVEVECREDQFLCEELNTCLNNTFICDRIEDCPGGFDESNCTEGCYLNFKCQNSSMCITNDARCDGIWDCDDGSDEENCRPTECAQHEVMCTDGSVCIKPVHICDNLYNCRDRSDEVGCVERTTCESAGKFFCNDGLCIPWALKCDGEYDCKDKEDEGNCTCLEEEFRCNDGKCLKSSMRCDGHRDCLYGEDERGCVKVDTQNMVMTFEPYSSSWSMLCADDWTFDDGQYLCQELGFGHALSTEKNHVSFNGTWMAMKRDNLTATSLWTERVTFAESCSSSLAASVTCQKFDCGNYSGLLHRRRRRQADSSSSSSHWPFVAFASTFKSNKGCVAKILTPIWLITSAECLLSLGVDTSNASTWFVRTNIANTVDKELAQNHEVQKIIFHPHSSKFRSSFLRDYDIVMIRLKHSLVFSDKIGAICLPEEQVPFGITCFTGVFGSEKPRESLHVSSLSLNSLALMLLDRKFCNQPEHYDGQVNQRMLCTKSSDNQRVCDNDEGTPLICLSGPNKWYLAGMLVYQRYCGTYSWHPDVFSNLYAIKKDIDQLTGQKNYEVPYNSDIYVIVPPTTLGPTDTTTVTDMTAAMTIVTTEISYANLTTLAPEFPRVDDHDSYIMNITDGNDTSFYNETETPPFNVTNFEEHELSNTTHSPNVSLVPTEKAKNIIKITTAWNLTVDDMPTLAPPGILNGTNEFSPLVQPNIEMLDDDSTFPPLYTNFTILPNVSETLLDDLTTISISNNDTPISLIEATTEQSDIPFVAGNLTIRTENTTEIPLGGNHSDVEISSVMNPDTINNSFFNGSNENHFTQDPNTVNNSTISPTIDSISTVMSVSTPMSMKETSSRISDIMLSDSARLVNNQPIPVSEINATIEREANVSSDESEEINGNRTTIISTTEPAESTMVDFVTTEPQTYAVNVNGAIKESKSPVKSAKIVESNSSSDNLYAENSTLLEDSAATQFATSKSTLEFDTPTPAAQSEISKPTTKFETEFKTGNQSNANQSLNSGINETNFENISSTQLLTSTTYETDDGNKTEIYLLMENATTEAEAIVTEFTTMAIENTTHEIMTMENKMNNSLIESTTEINEGTCGKWEFTINDTEHIVSDSNGFKFWPSLGILRRETEQKDCLCNILSSHYVITTLSCLLLGDNLLNPENWVFVNGELNSNSAVNTLKIPVVKIIGHPEQKVGVQFTENNLALVQLKDPIPFDEYSTSVCLPLHPTASSDNCYSAGWNKNGKTQNEFFSLKSTLVPLLVCNNSKYHDGTIMDTMTCIEYATDYVRACQMEIGTSLICHGKDRWELHGILTPHILCDSTKPAVYNSISSVDQWIKEIVFGSPTAVSNNTTSNFEKN